MNTSFATQRISAEPLYHIVFVSTATAPLSVKQVGKLVSTSTQQNETLGITGLLLYANERFMGCLEGPESAVKDTFASIRSDHRHKNIDMLRCENTEARLFSQWQMGVRNFAVDLQTLPFVSPFMHPDFDTSEFRDNANEVYRAMLAFRNEHGAG